MLYQRNIVTPRLKQIIKSLNLKEDFVQYMKLNHHKPIFSITYVINDLEIQ
jgi:hypothetical protein